MLHLHLDSCIPIPIMVLISGLVFSLVVAALAHVDSGGQQPIAGPHKGLWYNTIPGDGGTQVCEKNSYYSIIDIN